ncbi:MAG: hypothetical protein ACOCV1_02365 [Bacillota bacterium]
MLRIKKTLEKKETSFFLWTSDLFFCIESSESRKWEEKAFITAENKKQAEELIDNLIEDKIKQYNLFGNCYCKKINTLTKSDKLPKNKKSCCFSHISKMIQEEK